MIHDRTYHFEKFGTPEDFRRGFKAGQTISNQGTGILAMTPTSHTADRP